MSASDVQLIFLPSLGIIIDMPEQHAMARNERIPALLLAVLHDEVFLIIGSSHRHHVCLVANGEAIGVKTIWGAEFYAKSIIITAGTFLNGLMHV